VAVNSSCSARWCPRSSPKPLPSGKPPTRWPNATFSPLGGAGREWIIATEMDEGDALEIVEGRHPWWSRCSRRRTRRRRSADRRLSQRYGAGLRRRADPAVTGEHGGKSPTSPGRTDHVARAGRIWVPAKRGHIGLVDRIFSRVGASDDLARGNSSSWSR